MSPRPVVGRSTPDGFDAVVVGAGLAGLAAASRLAGEGWRVLILEARSRLGGRATAFVDAATGEPVDNGQHVLFGCYRETFALLRRVGATDGVRLQPDLEVATIDERGRHAVLRCPPLPAPLHLVAGVLEWEAVSMRDRLSVLGILQPLRLARRQARGRTSHLAASPGETVHDWLVLNGQSERLRRMLWEPLALAALNQSPRVAAAEPFVRVLGEMLGGDRSDSAVGLPAVPLDRLFGDPVRAFVEARGGVVRTGGAALIRPGLVRGGQLPPGRSAQVHVETAGTAIAATAVVCAVPWFALRRAVDDRIAREPGFDGVVARADALGASPIVTVNLWLDRPVIDRPFVGLPSRTLQWVFDKRLVWDGRAHHLSLVASGADELLDYSNDRLIALSLAELRDAIPVARGAAVTHASVVREPKATFSLAPAGVARPSTCTPFENLFLAGDWIATGLPGTIESAVVSGHRAAAEAARLLARPVPPPAL